MGNTRDMQPNNGTIKSGRDSFVLARNYSWGIMGMETFKDITYN
jgi:hypothetical protein